MIRIENKKDCCGCQACVNVCPKHCIQMKMDAEGFLYPKVDASSCIDCGLCEKICPNITPCQTREPLGTFAAINDNIDIRKASSSGGVFTLLAESVIKKQGVVFGARFDEKWQVVIDYTETIDGLAVFRGSKYVQASTGDSYKQCKELLNKGILVLYSGTPCQIAGLKHYLRKDYENLITVDFVCHGVPSPGIWDKYLYETLNTAHRAVDGTSSVSSSLNAKSLIKDIKFRDKTDGWDKYRFVLKFDKASAAVETSTVLSSLKNINQPAKQNPYFKAFYHNLILRPSCSSCKAKGFSSGSDITIADFWGAHHYVPDYYDNIGTSLIMVSTIKGLNTVNECVSHKCEFDYEVIKSFNYVIYKSVTPHKRRNVFFEKMEHAQSLTELIEETLAQTITEKIQERINWVCNIPVRAFKKIKKMI